VGEVALNSGHYKPLFAVLIALLSIPGAGVQKKRAHRRWLLRQYIGRNQNRIGPQANEFAKGLIIFRTAANFDGTIVMATERS
jgi:hypothetical protein